MLVFGFAFIHTLVLLVLWRLKKTTPKMLTPPRLELLIFMMVLPMIAAAAAGLMRSPSPTDVLLGVFFAVLLPLVFIVGECGEVKRRAQRGEQQPACGGGRALGWLPG